MNPAQFWQLEMQNQQNQQAQQEQNQKMIMDGISQFAGQYAADKALKAKGEAYGDFMKRHGQQLGFDPGYLEDFLKRDPREQAMIGDNIIGMQNTGNRLMGLNYMNQQANLFRAPRATPVNTGSGSGMGAAGGGGGSSFTF